MRLYDKQVERELSLPDLFRDWEAFRKEEPWNHCESFRDEMLNILMDTINGRNDCELIGMTPNETERIINKLRNVWP